MRTLYYPFFNTLLRRVLHPVRSLIPDEARFGIVAPFQLRLPNGRRLWIHGNETSYVSKVLFWDGVQGYEPHLLRLYTALAQQARTVVDVGANLGYYSLLARAYNPAARVVAFEPMPAALHYLGLNLAANGMADVQVERLALSDAEGRAAFYEGRNPKFPHVERHLTGASSFDVPGGRYDAAPPVTVATTTLDAFSDAHDLTSIDLLKIDAEGAEALVLRGARRVLARYRPIVLFEADPGPQEADVEALLGTQNYLVYNARPEGIIPVDHLAPHNTRWHDFVAVPQERVADLASFIVPS